MATRGGLSNKLLGRLLERSPRPHGIEANARGEWLGWPENWKPTLGPEGKLIGVIEAAWVETGHGVVVAIRNPVDDQVTELPLHWHLLRPESP